MTNSHLLYLNTRYAGRPVTGVERYAHEIASRLPGWIRCAPPRPLQGFTGHVWEQFILPGLVGDGLLWSPANTGPLAVTNQVVTIHDLAPLEHPEWYRRSFAGWYAFSWPRLVQRVRAVISSSQFSRLRIIERLGVPAGSVHVVPAGVDPDFYYPRSEADMNAVRERLGLPDRYLLFIGSVQPRKNLPALLRAWERVRAEHPGWTLVIAGASGGPFARQEFQTVPGLRFTGRVAEADLPALYSAAGGLVQPSIYEGAGLTVLEAMACGCPVVASGNTALPEYVGEAGLLFDPYAGDEIQAAVAGLLTDAGLRNELRAKGIERARKFSWARSTDLAADVLRGFISLPRSL